MLASRRYFIFFNVLQDRQQDYSATENRGVVQFEFSHLTIAMQAWKLASVKAMPLQSNIM